MHLHYIYLSIGKQYVNFIFSVSVSEQFALLENCNYRTPIPAFPKKAMISSKIM